MARKLMDVLLGRTQEEVDGQDPEKVRENLEKSYDGFDTALVQGSRARKQQTNGLKKATEALRTVSSPKLKVVTTE